MKLRLSPVSICRSPIFPVDEKLENVWQELSAYIHESSPAFFEIIRDYSFADYESATPKIRFTIWKYFNRAKFRATPYGNFATFSLVPLADDQKVFQLRLLKQPLIHRFANWQEKEQINSDPKWLLKNTTYFRTNMSIYQCGDELRYINIENSNFELSAVSNEEMTKSILDFCRNSRTLADIQAFPEFQKLSKSTVRNLVEQLISFQLLLSNYQPNIIGTDYFSRIGYFPGPKKNDYIIAERKWQSGHLREKDLNVLIEAADFLNKNGLPGNSTAMEQFKTQFIKRFEDKEVPLLAVMDPETGIGYLSLIQDKNEDPLLQELKSYAKTGKRNTNQMPYEALHQFILNQMMNGKAIQLEQMKSTTLPAEKMIANTISILFHQSDEHLVIEQMGGCTANALLGRFTMASEEATKLGKRFVAIEEQANPEIIFFDIAYQIEKNADNINRRKSIYGYELPILSWTDTGEALDMADIMVSVSSGELILRSVKYGKRLVPKLASAYNYTRSDLSVFRFLSDLQHQNLHSGLTISFSQLFPGLSHYQRIQYKNVVLSPEKWAVPDHFLKAGNTGETLAGIDQWLSEISLARPFKCGSGDQMLLFDPASENDMLAFLLFCKNQKELYIEEAFIPVSSAVRDEDDRPYLSEFIVNLEHDAQIYQPCEDRGIVAHNAHLNGIFVPGNEWLYFEIYCHPIRSDAILMDIADSFISVFRSKIKTWFFIRYNDPSDHIRLRLQLKDSTSSESLISGLSVVLRSYISTGIIADLQLKTYRRENYRYGTSRMGKTEQCFNADSDLILSLIAKPATVNQLYSFSIILLQTICDAAGFSPESQLAFAENISASFAAEMGIKAEGFKKINLAYKDFEINTIPLKINGLTERKLRKTENTFLEILASCKEAEKFKILSDLFHMHTNRLFNADQRMHEMIMYYYLTRKLKTKIARSKIGKI